MIRRLVEMGSLAAFLLIVLTGHGWTDDRKYLSSAARKAVGTMFPDAKLHKVWRFREKKFIHYKLVIKDDGKHKGVEVSEAGVIYKVTYRVSRKSLSRDAKAAAKRKLRGGKIKTVEMHEKYAEIIDDKWVPLEKPVMAYFITFTRKNLKGHVYIPAGDSEDEEDNGEDKDKENSD